MVGLYQHIPRCVSTIYWFDLPNTEHRASEATSQISLDVTQAILEK